VNQSTRNRYRSCLLGTIAGAVASILSAGFCSVFPELPLTIGDLLLFVAAGTLGLSSTIIMMIVAISYEWILTANVSHIARVSFLAVTWAILCARNPRWSGFGVVVCAWLAGVFPASWAAQSFWYAPISWSTVTHWFASDLFFTLLASITLSNREIYSWFAGAPARHRPKNTLSYTLALSVLVAVVAPNLLASTPYSPQSWQELLAWGLFTIAVPYWLGRLLSSKLAAEAHSQEQSQLLARSRDHTFSGLSSSIWRQRKSSDEIGFMSTRSSDSNTRLLTPHPDSGTVSPEVAICAVDNIGTITFANRKFRRLLGVSEDDVVGKKIDAVQMIPAARTALVRHFETTQKLGPYTSEARLNQLPENLRYFEISSERAEDLEASALSSSHGDLILSVRDITKRRAVETQLLQAQRVASLGNFISGIGHTFNNTLMAIIGHCSAAQRESNGEWRNKRLSEAISASWSAADQVKKLVDFAEGPPSLAEYTDINALVSEHKGLLQGMVGARCILNIHTAGPLGVSCDPNLILQAITNLVLNSRDAYQTPGGSIDITLGIEEIPEEVSAIHVGARPGTFVRLRVQDRGIGMTADILAHAFDPMFTTRKTQGHAGLGLSTVFAIVRAHDGFLTVESQPSEGTTISLYLPQAEQPAYTVTARQSTQQPPNESVPSKAKILVVEDEDTIRSMVVMMLGRLGYEVSGCENGAEAIDRCSSQRFDLLLVDVAMPQMAGPELIKRLQEMADSPRTVLMTGYGQIDDSGITPCLAKPFDIETLQRTVASALALPHTATN
jgi:PAS domain S-box-containing protein